MKTKLMNYGNTKLVVAGEVLRKGQTKSFNKLSEADLEKAKIDSNNCIIVSESKGNTKSTEGDKK